MGKTNPSSTIAVAVTCDGTNYETINNGEFTTCTNAGTSLGGKVTGTIAADEGIVFNGYTINYMG